MTGDAGGRIRRGSRARQAAAAAVVAALAGWALVGTLPVGPHSLHANERGVQHAFEKEPEPPPPALDGHSLYQLGSRWRDDRGAVHGIGALRGRPVVLVMLYTSCEDVCPVLVQDVKRIEQLLAPGEREQVTFALFSFDPARDTPQRLAAHRAKHGLARENWRLLTGAAEDVLELAAVLGIRYQPAPGGGFNHSNLITVLDRAGVVRHRQVGIRTDPTDTLATLRRLLTDPTAAGS